MLISISLALLVIVAGMLLLAKTKKDDLGGIYKFVSYAVITCGIVMSAFSFVSCIVKCQSGGCSSSSYKASCNGNFHGASSKCASWSKKCSKKGYGSSSCAKGNAKGCCSKKSKCKNGGKNKEYTKTIIKGESEGEERVDVKIEIKE